MSNTAVGQVYKRIIDAVIEQSRTDFEENGVNNATLTSLQNKWQDRLSNSHRALFPWDPQPDTPARPPEPSPAPLTDTRPTPTPTPGHDSARASGSPVINLGANGTAAIKQEPGQTDTSYPNLPQTTAAPHNASGLNQAYAAQRAQHLLQQQFGSQASGSIGAIQAADKNGSNAQARASAQDQQNSQTVKRENPEIKQEDGANDMTISQTDGASDQWTAVVAQRNAKGDYDALGRFEVDGIIRRQVEEMAQRLEGGGLMIPLRERRRPSHANKQKRLVRKSRESVATSAPSTADHSAENFAPLGPLSRYDGTDGSSPPLDDVDVDDDAINSELDDSDDGLDNIEAGFDGDVILCLYDKVQRVKNKWKCTLKDGVVTVKGKDYVFHKAQGEFEW